ncbi:MICOS complex subunit Mic60 isoform X2 [Harpegnathos saltator]|uniref:MICOS complex subunit Mic60 isoform X2 n=1 Tax=Harpegnathos saltator TaxID=610380 RepID=UPI00058F4014|nr:MICOS complex subunit Mic60 isoform X2 [Harpegnathos saltator]
MFRIGLKFPCNGLNRIKKHGCSRLYLTARCYETRAHVKYEPDGRLGKDVRLMSRLTGPKYSTAPPRSEKSKVASKALITLGAVTIGSLGILTYAKNNPETRATLEGWIPGTDKAIRIIFQEDATYFDLIFIFFATLKQTIMDMLFKSGSSEPAPTLVSKPLVKNKEILDQNKETRINTEEVKVDVVVEKTSPPKNVSKESISQSLVELETSCSEVGSKAIAAYRKATNAIGEYNRDVAQVIESNSSAVSEVVWQRLKEATEKKKEAMQEMERHAEDALDSLKRMYNKIDETVLDAPAHMKTATRRNVKKILDDVDEAKRKYKDEIHNNNITERYWKQIKLARENFNEELKILFPSLNIHEKKLSISEEAFDIFVLYMYHKVNNLQQELEKLRTISETKIKSALRASGENASEEQLEALVSLAVNEEKLILQEEQEKMLLAEQKKFDQELRRELKLQSEIHSDHLREALSVKEQETQRKLQRALSEQTEAESIKYKTQLAVVVGKLHALSAALKARMEDEKGISNRQIFWSACQALGRAVKIGPPGTLVDKVIRPLEPEINAISKAAPRDDPLVCAAIRGIPEEAAKRGVFPEDALRKRFLKVEDVARRLAMVPEEGASLPIYFLSYLQSFLVFRTANPISKSELEDEPIDVNSLNTYDILHRARYWLDRGDFKMTLRYMNLLKGAPRSVARDWMNETRILLETQLAVDTLLAHVGATGLFYLGAEGSPKKKLAATQTTKRFLPTFAPVNIESDVSINILMFSYLFLQYLFKGQT